MEASRSGAGSDPTDAYVSGSVQDFRSAVWIGTGAGNERPHRREGPSPPSGPAPSKLSSKISCRSNSIQ